MGDTMIRVENLGKLYHIGAVQRGPRTLIGSVAGATRSTLRRVFDSRLARSGTSEVEELWALKDLSFDVERGDVLGIIGRNGSGKSTLLKILSRITAPTEGHAQIFGRVGSLLEVGIGFHPQLTGRENVYLSGAILGLKRSATDRVFDEIVAFAEVERFIDTPVKHYSSGMHVRLAFAVAAQFNPEILILDEVLAVGDASFQKKSLDRMDAAAKDGRTVLFVSHSLSAISRLCDKGIYLADGRLKYLGTATDAIKVYLRDIHKIDDERIEKEGDILPNYLDLRNSDKRLDHTKQHILTWISSLNANGEPTAMFTTGESIRIRIGYHLEKELSVYCNLNFMNYVGIQVMTVGLHHSKPRLRLVGDGYLECVIPHLPLATGRYIIQASIGEHGPNDQRNSLDAISDTLHIDVVLGDYLGGYEVSQVESTFAQKSEWSLHSTSNNE